MSSRDRQGPPKSPVDRLVEAGLSAYGRGELDDALVAWESALAMDPDDARAIAYVDYVRQHYELVTGGAEPGLPEEELGVPFGLGDDDGDYDIELSQEGRLLDAQAVRESLEAQTVKLPPPVMLDPRDEGWGLEEDVFARASIDASGAVTLELEADEPPDPVGAEFEDKSTAEYQNPAAPRKKPGPSSPGFLPAEHPEPTTDEFAILEATTGVGQRALGFVQPTGKPAQAAKPKAKPELKVNIRTPAEGADAAAAPPRPPEPGEAIDLDDFPAGTRHGDHGGLVLELEIGDDAPPAATPPDVGTAKTAPGLTEVEARALDRSPSTPPVPANPRASDFGERSEGPTRDLGLAKQPPGAKTQTGPGMQRRPAEVAPAASAAPPPTAPVPVVPEKSERSTANLSKRKELVKSAVARVDDERDEPTLARTRTAEGRAQVIAEVDRDAPPGEAPGQRVKRRIAALIALAQTAAHDHRLERAVLAIDAAFTQDPDSAIAQKLFQQHREAIMAVFTEYLGDLERRPRLARSMSTVVGEPIDSRAAFLLSRVDGSLSYEELLDVSGMPRLEAARYLCQLVLRGLLSSE